MKVISLLSFLLRRKARREVFQDENKYKRLVPMPYKRKDFFLSEAEREFFFALEHSVGGRYLVFAKVRIADIIDVEEDVVLYKEYLFRITHKHVDFVLCRKNHLDPILAIELDDSTHLLPERIERDVFVDAVFARAGLKLLHIPAQRYYNCDLLEEAVDRVLGINQKPF